MFKNKEGYIEMRNAMLAEAEALVAAGDTAAFSAKEKEIKDLDASFENFTTMQANLSAMQNQRVLIDPMNSEPFAKAVIKADDPFNTIEYRKSFMNFAKTGIMDETLRNTNALTTVSEAAAQVPTTILNEIIKTMKQYGQIFSRVRKINIKGGVDVPILSLKPVASWIDEATPSDRLKVTANTKVSFSYYGLECKVAISLLADVTTLDGFESTITELIVEANVKALDTAIIKGSGTGAPTGITVDTRIPSGNIITLASGDFVSFAGWKRKVFAKIPLSYRAGGSWIMSAGTFEGYIDGMVDEVGQPVGRVNYNGVANGSQERFGGREVILVEDDIVTPYETASTGDIVAVFANLNDYAINSNMTMSMFRWLDHDTNQYVDKSLLVADGKILDPNGVIIVKKGA